jgi:hypothetical protein
MNCEAIITELQSRCQGCKIHAAIEALQALAETLGSCDNLVAVPAEPIKAQKTQEKPKQAAKSGQPAQTPGKDRVCNKCGILKLLEEFPKSKECSYGRAGVCKACVSERAKKNWAEAQATKKASSDSDKAHPPKAEPKPEQHIDAILPAKEFKCACGRTFYTRMLFKEHQEKCEA